jgi:hypothetical protein
MEKKTIIIGLVALVVIGGALYLHNKKKGKMSSTDGDDESSNFQAGGNCKDCTVTCINRCVASGGSADDCVGSCTEGCCGGSRNLKSNKNILNKIN